jgi:diguanylate cyclase (GGDEF)-like protein
VATLASIAINNAFLFEMATTDMMTKLKLKHYLYTVLDEWIEQASSNEGFSMLMFDIDFFKRVNDTYGHSCGDIVLKQVARIILDSTRSSDLAARYGGEEFVVLISYPGKNMALRIAERIRKAVEGNKIQYKEDTLGVTISCGVASFDKAQDTSATAMVERADKALYQSKQGGRNRITLSD